MFWFRFAIQGLAVKQLGRAAVFIALVFMTVAAHAASQPAPAYWKVQKGQATVYIFGTIHLMTADVPWFTPEIQQVFDQADTLVLEVAPEELDPAIMGPLMGQHGVYRDGRTLRDTLPPEVYRELVEMAAGIGLPEQNILPMRPWLVGVILTAQMAVAQGILPEHGVDVTLIARATELNKPIQGLETAEAQFSAFGSISEAAELELLVVSLDQLKDIAGLFAEMRDTWLVGDLGGLKTSLIDPLLEIPEAMDKLLTNRNRSWIPGIMGLLDGDGSYFVAVGAGHLIGPENIIDLLSAQGLTIEKQ